MILSIVVAILSIVVAAIAALAAISCSPRNVRGVFDHHHDAKVIRLAPFIGR
jgi:hypothetical protein